ncbi:uncharacterized protein BXIN_0649 [Babesia sp. Xinjiang]|uniref:uncharacterized protein n=1 Tax=Babesia sp. Xinjiang TaxID=462227 RepID=UPI000A221577|nr:uncharacterized protein BXIN_0649 [Babesia sp. Xinjiang]ORM41865.1 hypothetical protein BXIN_0649 [Babesia sp. Xinjiang]
MKATPLHLQRSYDYENAGDSDNVYRNGSSDAASMSQRSTIDSNMSVGEAYEDLFLLQEIAFDLPELESTLSSSTSNMKHRNSFAFPAWLVDTFQASTHFILIAVFVFFIGCIAGFFMASPTGFSGNKLWESSRTDSQSQHKLFVIEGKSDQSITLEGTLYLSHHVMNPTPFSASLYSSVSVSYMPTSDKWNEPSNTCLDERVWQGDDDNFKELLEDPMGRIFRPLDKSDGHIGFHSDAVCEGDDPYMGDNRSLITLKNVKSVRISGSDYTLKMGDSLMFDVFKSYLLFSNRLHVVTHVDSGLNEVSYLVSVNQVIHKNDKTKELIRLLLADCKRGHLLLRLASIDQRFETMFFGGDMLPQKFLPVSVPCEVSKFETTARLVTPVQRQQTDFFMDQLKILLNMGTITNPRCPLRPSSHVAGSN